MADGFTFTADWAAVQKVLDDFPHAATLAVKSASKETAFAVQRGAQSRVAVLSGSTQASIVVRDARRFPGYVVQMADELSPTALARRLEHGKLLRKGRPVLYEQALHTGLWLERGTKKGKPGSHALPARPFLWPAAEIEQGPYRRRLIEELKQTASEKGLGE